MADDSTTDSLIAAAFGALLRHGMTIVAGYLVGINLLPGAQQESFVQLGVGLALGALGLLWSYLNKKWHIEALSGLQNVITLTQQEAARVPQQAKGPGQ